MTRTIPLTQIVSCDSFLEGSSIYKTKSFIITAVTKKDDSAELEGILKTDPEKKIKVSARFLTGEIIKNKCGYGCPGICEHVVGLILFYNEIELDGTAPLDQLTSISLKKRDFLHKTPYSIRIEKSEINVENLSDDDQFSKITELIGERKVPALVALFPEMFVVGSNRLKPAEKPLDMYYRTENNSLTFNFSPEMYYYHESGVVIDAENYTVWRFDRKTANVVSTLLNLSMEFQNLSEIANVVNVLSRNIYPSIELKGDIDIEIIDVDENVPLLFQAEMKKGKIYMSVFFDLTDHLIEFKPRRKNLDQNYVADKKMYVISTTYLKRIKSALSSSGFRYSGKKYAASADKYHEINDKNSLLGSIGKVTFINDIKRISLEGKKSSDSQIDFDLNVKDKWFSFKIKLPESPHYIAPDQFINAVKQIEQGMEDPVIEDSSGEMVILEKSNDFIKRISEMLPGVHPSSWQKVPFGHLLKMLKSDNRKIIKNFYGDKESKEIYANIFNSIKNNSMPEIDIPLTIKKELRKYQIEGLKWLHLLKSLNLGGVLADEMGLGKTIQSLAMIKMEKEDKPSMVIAPKTLVWSWDREIDKFFPEMNRVIIDSLKPEERSAKWKQIGNNLVITSYSIAVNDFKFFKDKDFKTIIVDEAQHIKNHRTKRFGALVSVKAENKFALTGTPIENHIRDLWSIFQFVMPGFLGNRKDIDSIEKKGDESELSKLSSLTAPFILRRTKKETLKELPQLTIKEYPVEMTTKQKEVYLSVLLRGRAEYIENKDEMNSVQILSILSRLRLAANHPSLVKEADFPVDVSGKILTIMELVEEIVASNGKVLIFSQYVKMLRIIEKALIGKDIGYFYMDGSTKNRMDIVNQFNEGKKPVFLLSLKVGGVGLNLTGADNVIITDPWWNPAVEEQAWSRAHRIGQKKRVVVHKLFSKGTIEEKILDMQIRKKGLTDRFMSKTVKDPSEDFIKMIADMELSVNG
jgi:SNF2 family DNA or RNA helicase